MNDNTAELPVALQKTVESEDHALVGRYRVDLAGGTRNITSISAPNIRVLLTPGVTVTRSGLKDYSDQTIFLDGAYSGAPFHDIERRQYSLDHHEGCIRSITLATCEQAAVVLLTGLPLNEGTWTLVVNEPDLDAILACWVLMNYIDLLRNNAALLGAVMPLLRTEGNVDTHGFGKEILSGLPLDRAKKEQEKLTVLRRPIVARKAAQKWTTDEYETVVLSILDAMDRLALPDRLIDELLEYKELGRVRLRGRRIALLCRSVHGIYETEAHLRQRYGKSLGLVILDQGSGKFTVRRCDNFGVLPLGPLFAGLNRLDHNANPDANDGNQWGGSDDIGGSPRSTGSALSGEEILKEVHRAFGKPPKRLARILVRLSRVLRKRERWT